MLGGDSQVPAVTVGSAGNSLLIKKVSAEDSDERMPAEGDRLSQIEIEVLRAWIDGGDPLLYPVVPSFDVRASKRLPRENLVLESGTVAFWHRPAYTPGNRNGNGNGNGHAMRPTCPECSSTVMFQEGCVTCQACGWNQCGS